MWTPPLKTIAAATPIVALVVLLTPSTARAVASCDPPQVLIVLDKSSSMTNLVPGTSDTKWDVAVSAINGLLSTYGAAVDFGLMIFPDPNECSPGSVMVDVGPGTSATILGMLGTPPPTGGNWTPMAESLDATAAYTPLQDVTRRNYVLLITDGWQWCSPYDPMTRFAPVTAAQNLLGLGIETYTVGFGGGVDVLALNQVAYEGGTGPMGCDPNGEDPTAPNLCYFQADNFAVLSSALTSIVVQITTEVCDGIDNDCNGTVDDVATPCTTACGTGIEICSGGIVIGCTAMPEGAETCNNVDDDCDGTIDEGCSCVDGYTMKCGTDIGACASGTQTCVGGAWDSCVGSINPAPAEACNGVDDDCNGIVDDGFLCAGDEACVDGICEPITKPMPVDPVADEEFLPGGCHCRLASPGSNNRVSGAALGVLLAALVLLSLRRRRRRSR